MGTIVATLFIYIKVRLMIFNWHLVGPTMGHRFALMMRCRANVIFASQVSDPLPPLPLDGFRQAFKHSNYAV